MRAYILTDQYEVYGNIKSFNSQGSLPPVIDDFEPKFGPIGTEVTIEGKNFALSKNGNTVKFGDVEAIVNSATENSIIVTIPKISKPEMVQVTVETAGMTGTSQDSFDLWFPWLQKKDFSSINNNSASFTIGNTGYSINSNSSTMFTYNPIEDKWQNNINLPQNSGDLPLAINIDEMAYVLFDNALWVYNKSENNWSQKKSFPDTREYDNSYTFIINTGKSFGIGNLKYHKYFWVYNIITDEWEQRNNFPGNLGRSPWGVFTCNIQGKSYLGMKADYSEQFWEYDIENSTWNLLGNFPKGIAHSNWVYFIIENELYLGLGKNFGWSGGFVSNKIWKYDINNDSWIEYRSCPNSFSVKAGFSINNKGYFISSYTRYYKKIDNVWEFDPSKN